MMGSFDRDYAKVLGENTATEHSGREPRQRTLMRAIMTLPGMAGEPVMVRNVSENGMCLATKALLPKTGETIEINLSGTGGLQANVRWVRGQEFGVRLSRPLDLRTICLANQRRNGDMAGTLGGQVETRLCGLAASEARHLYAC